MKFPKLNETTLRADEYYRLLQTEHGKRIIIENANAKAEERMERQKRSRKRKK